MYPYIDGLFFRDQDSFVSRVFIPYSSSTSSSSSKSPPFPHSSNSPSIPHSSNSPSIPHSAISPPPAFKSNPASSPSPPSYLDSSFSTPPSYLDSSFSTPSTSSYSPPPSSPLASYTQRTTAYSELLIEMGMGGYRIIPGGPGGAKDKNWSKILLPNRVKMKKN